VPAIACSRSIPRNWVGAGQSIWDIFRCQVPLLALVMPSRAGDVARSLLVIKEQGGDIPRWPIATTYSGCMIGTHAGIILADLAVKGLLTEAEIEEAYAGARAAVTSDRVNAGRGGWQDYAKLGYLPTDGYGDAASKTLAYAFDDSAIASLADLAGNATDAAFFRKRSLANYRNIWHPEANLFCPRKRDGTWACPIDPTYAYAALHVTLCCLGLGRHPFRSLDQARHTHPHLQRPLIRLGGVSFDGAGCTGGSPATTATARVMRQSGGGLCLTTSKDSSSCLHPGPTTSTNSTRS
jgi:hypothetical protein